MMNKLLHAVGRVVNVAVFTVWAAQFQTGLFILEWCAVEQATNFVFFCSFLIVLHTLFNSHQQYATFS